MTPILDPSPAAALDTEQSIRPHIIRGYSWMLGMRWGIRLLGLVSTVVLARLLAPADFGLVAMAMLFVGLIEIFCETGQQLALIRHPSPTRDHYDSAWTISILISLGLTMVLVTAAPLAALYFPDERIVPIIQVLSLRVFFRGFENIGVTNFRRDLDFRREFQYGMIKKVMSFVFTISLAVSWQSYWVLVIGIVFAQFLTIPLSYWLHPYRPRLSFAKVSDLWSFSIWALIVHIGAYVQSRLDEFVVGGVAPATTMGHYSVAAELAALPSSELAAPLGRALFPAYAKLINEPKELAKSYLNVLSVIAIFCTSACTGIALVCRDLVLVVLGEKWLASVPFMPWLALAAGIAICCETVYLVLTVTGQPRRAALQSWWRVLLELPVLLLGFHLGGLIGISIAKLVAITLLAPVYFYQLSRVIPVTGFDIARVTWRPVVASAIMAVGVKLLPETWPVPPIVDLLLLAAIGAGIFVIAMTALWALSNRPDGPERSALKFLRVVA